MLALLLMAGLGIGGCTKDEDPSPEGDSNSGTGEDADSDGGDGEGGDGDAGGDGDGDPTAGDGDGDGDESGDGDGGDSDSEGGESDGVVFIQEPDGGVGAMCDPQGQDCPEGQKCTAWGDSGGAWNANKCVEDGGNLVPGDVCEAEGGKYTGVDQCEKGSICWLMDNDGTNGTCLEFCMGDACGNGQVCTVYNNGSLPLCLDRCDPLVQDCPNDLGCYSGPGNDFLCLKPANEEGQGQRGSACNGSVNVCLPGLFCGAAGRVDGCPDTACCTNFCSVSDGGSDCEGTEECVPWFEMDPPPGLEDLGGCVTPA